MAERAHPDAPSKWSMTVDVLRSARLVSPKLIAILAGYYILTPLNSALEGLSWLLLVNAFSAGVGLPMGAGRGLSLFLSWLPASALADTGAQLRTVSLMFLLKAALTGILLILEGAAQAFVRRGLQSHCVERVMNGRWEDLRQGSIGRWVGAATEESTLFSNYFMMGVRTIYALASFAVLAAMALMVDAKLSLFMLLVSVPSGLILRLLYRLHGSLASRFAQARQRFAADATERLTGLFQIKAFGDLSPHLKAALESQADFTRAELALARSNGVINAYTPLLLPILLMAFWVWMRWHGLSVGDHLAVLGGVGVLGFRAMAQLSTLVSSAGNVASYSGCLWPVWQLCRLPEEPAREPIAEPLKAVELRGVSYLVGPRPIFQEMSLSIPADGRLFLVAGPSGAGKSTLANLISGLYAPSSGEVAYVGESGRRYDARRFRARIGYVTQDVFLFRGSVRMNLDPRGRLAEDELWRCLEQAGAAAFVKARGGLDAEVAEAGRSLSGGERRRLAIASTLAQRANCLILDEVTNGLDEASKTNLVRTIAALSRDILVIAISHDLAAFEGVDAEIHTVGGSPKPSAS